MNHERVLSAVLAKSKIAPGGGPPPNFSGVWKNEHGSTANFTIDGSTVSGIYTSQVSGAGGSITGPISGQVSADTIAFVVAWPTKTPTITAWVGQLVVDPGSGARTLETLWYLITDISEDPTEFWESILAGADNFTPVP
jgi:hypothetical protein